MVTTLRWSLPEDGNHPDMVAALASSNAKTISWQVKQAAGPIEAALHLRHLKVDERRARPAKVTTLTWVLMESG